MAFDGIVLSRVVEALNKRIATGRISKIYTISQNELLMNVRAHNKNQKLLVSIHPMYARVKLTDLNYPTPDSPNALTMLMRKHMDGAFIADIEQVGLDRILKLTLKGRNDFKDEVTYYAYIEIMGKYSNFILTYENNKIIVHSVEPFRTMTGKDYAKYYFADEKNNTRSVILIDKKGKYNIGDTVKFTR